MKVKDIISSHSIWMPNPEAEIKKPIFSVILPTYSRARDGILNKCIDSILNQTFRQLELIIVIDGSTDGTFDICKRYMEADSRVHLIWHEHNMGLPAVSTYEAYEKARGKYFAYAVDDNQWKLNALEKTYRFMEKRGIKASFGITRVIDNVSGNTVEFGRETTPGSIMEQLWAGNKIGAGSVVLHREVLEKVGLHDPHLALTRVCDWDLWLRVIEHYPFVATNIPFTFEMGMLLPDSLGNTFKMDQWFVHERQQHRNLVDLLPENYEDCDILEYNTDSSEHYMQCLGEHYKQYRNKNWYSEGKYEEIETAVPSRKHRHILVACESFDASLMNFSRCNSNIYTFAYFHMDALLVAMLLHTDIAVLVRRPTCKKLEEMCKIGGIPCYYFTDDNFHIIKGYENVARQLKRENLAWMQGVIVTSEPLRKYMLDYRIHDKVLVLDAVYKQNSRGYVEGTSKPFTIGFMGGAFREGVFSQCVLPALYRIAKSHPIRLICPCTHDTWKKTKALAAEGLEIVPFMRTSIFELAINTYAEAGLDLLIHCGDHIKNNLYKTKNALINATSLGAPLLVSDIQPYCDMSDGTEDTYLLTANTTTAWENAIRSLMEDRELRSRLYENAAKHCAQYYEPKAVWAELEEEFSSLPTHDLFYYFKRSEQLINWIQTVSVGSRTVASGKSHLPIYGANQQRLYIPGCLRYSGRIVSRKYGFTATVEQIREIGLLFAVEGECTGTVDLSFSRKNGKPLANCSLALSDLIANGYTDITLPHPVEAHLNELLYVEIKVKYKGRNGNVGVYEDSRYRTFMYRVFNKLKCPIPGKNALFVDCRS